MFTEQPVMDCKGSSPEQPTTGFYLVHYIANDFPKIYSNIILPSVLCSPHGLYISEVVNRILYAYVNHT